MALSIDRVPGDIAFSRNQMIVEFTAKDANGFPYGPAAAKSVWEMNNMGLYTNELIKITYSDEDGNATQVVFTAVVSPAAEDEVSSYSGTGAITDHYNAVLSKIAMHPLLQPFLTFTTVFSTTYELIATANSTDSNIVVSWDVTGVQNAIGSTDFLPGSTTAPDNYKVKLDLFFEPVYTSGGFSTKISLEATPDEDGKVFFNIAKTLDDELRTTLTSPNIPAYTDEDPYINDILRNYYFRFRESGDGVGPPESDWVVHPTKKVLCGGIATNLFADFDFFSSLNESNSLLTWYPDGKKVSPVQKEWIAWYNFTGGNTYIKIQKTVIDTTTGDETETIQTSPPFPVSAGEVAVIPVGYEQLGIAGDSQQYKIRILDSWVDNVKFPYEPLSQYRTYNVDHYYYKEERYLMYLNGFCCPETLRCVGEHSTDLEVKRLESNHVLSPDYTALFSEVRQYGQAFKNYFTYRTGYISAPEKHALQELLIYGDLYEIYNEGYIPLRLKGKKFFIVETREHLNAYALVAFPSTQQRNYSNINIPLAPEQNFWATSWGDFWQTAYGQKWKIA